MTIDLAGRLARLRAAMLAIPAFTGDIWYIDGTDGDDANSGRTPSQAYVTIGQGLISAVAGDAIAIKAGNYDEIGLDLALDGLELWCEIGVHIEDSTPGTALVVSGDHCRVQGAHFEGPGAIAIQVTGDHCSLATLFAENVTVGYDIDGADTLIDHTISAAHTVTGYDISGPQTIIQHAVANGVGGATRGFYLSNAAADYCLLEDCSSLENATAGYECVVGTAGNMLRECVSGVGDGDRIDLDPNNFWANYVQEMETEHNEHVYPVPDGEGTAGAAVEVNADAEDETHGAATTQNYWGEPTVVLQPAILTLAWTWIGMNIFATTTGKEFRSLAYKIDYSRRSARNAGNAWDEGETDLTVADGSIFQTDDLVWVYSTYKTDGEIVKVSSVAGPIVTVVRETSQFGAPNTGLRWNHTINAAGTEIMYLVRRDGEQMSEGYFFDFGAAGARDMIITRWHEAKRMDGSDGVLVRTINGSDSVNNGRFDCALIYGE